VDWCTHITPESHESQVPDRTTYEQHKASYDKLSEKVKRGAQTQHQTAPYHGERRPRGDVVDHHSRHTTISGWRTNYPESVTGRRAQSRDLPIRDSGASRQWLTTSFRSEVTLCVVLLLQTCRVRASKVSKLLALHDEVLRDTAPDGDTGPRSQWTAKTKTYNRRDSQMVTHSSTSRPVQCLCMAERTGCPVLTDLWSYVSF
jgi:hypothetical protein